jgi:hypothetical protein
MDSLESMPGLLKSLQIRVLACRYDNPIPTRFLAPIDCFKIPAQMGGVSCLVYHLATADSWSKF